MATEIREARLRPEYAGRYPMLPVRWWSGAARVSGIVDAWQARFGVRDRGERLLPGDCFEFRGGSARGSESAGLRTRAGEAQDGPC